MAWYFRRKAGDAPLARWRHPAFSSANPALQAAAAQAQHLGETHSWDRSTTRLVLDGLSVLLEDRPAGHQVTLSEIRAHTPRRASTPRVAEVLTGLGLLAADEAPAIRAWIDRCSSELSSGFSEVVRAWLLQLLDGSPRTRPRAQSTLYIYFGAVKPFIKRWSAQYDHPREITTGDLEGALNPLRGHQRRNSIAALRSLFHFAKKHGLVFTNPTARLRSVNVEPSLLPMTDAEIRVVEQIASDPAPRLIIVLAAVQAARASTIQHLLLDDLDLPNRRITIAGHTQRLGELTYRALQSWLEQRHAKWPHTPNPHVLVSGRTGLGVDPISKGYFHFHLRRHGVSLDRVRKDRILHEALSVGADPLHLALVFNLSQTTASRYARIAQNLLDDRLETDHLTQ